MKRSWLEERGCDAIIAQDYEAETSVAGASFKNPYNRRSL